MKAQTALRTSLLLIVISSLVAAFANSLNRTLVEMPAWHQLGAQAWAAFSRRADLGNGGYLYPISGIGGTILILAAAIVFRLSPRRPWSVAIPLYTASLMVICVMLTTTQAAPAMLSLRRIGDDPAALQQAFETFYRWDSIRAVCVALDGCAKVLALVALAALVFEKKTSPQERETAASSAELHF